MVKAYVQGWQCMSKASQVSVIKYEIYHMIQNSVVWLWMSFVSLSLSLSANGCFPASLSCCSGDIHIRMEIRWCIQYMIHLHVLNRTSYTLQWNHGEAAHPVLIRLKRPLMWNTYHDNFEQVVEKVISKVIIDGSAKHQSQNVEGKNVWQDRKAIKIVEKH